MTNLVSLGELLNSTGVDNGAEPLYDADSLHVERGPTPQTCVIHGGKNTAEIRKLVDELDSTHPEVVWVDPDAPKPAKSEAPKPAPEKASSRSGRS